MLHIESIGKISRITEPQESIVWSIPNVFFTWPSEIRRDTYVTSPPFSLKGFTWRMIAKEEKGYLGLFIWMLDCKSVIPEHEIELGLKSYNAQAASKSFVGKLDPLSRCGKWDFMNLQNLRSCRICFFPNGFLDFSCEMRFIEGDGFSLSSDDSEISPEVSVVEIQKDDGPEAEGGEAQSLSAKEEEKNHEPETEGVDRLLQNLKTVLLEGQNSDMTLKVENRDFAVHKVILSVRSPVFASMLQHDMAEKHTDIVDIPDCSAEAFEVFLLYLYTGSANTMSRKNVFNLYYIADKYSVHDLKKDCVDFMKNTLSVDTFCDVITLSLRHGESELQKVATGFFSENMKKIIKTVQWQTYIQEYPTHVNELS